jgi:hypothetical protein
MALGPLKLKDKTRSPINGAPIIQAGMNVFIADS